MNKANMYEYKTFAQLIKDEWCPFTVGELRSFLLKRDQNGLSKAIRKVGKKLYFRMDLFEDWIEHFSEDKAEVDE